VTEGLADEFQPVEDANGREDACGGGALAAARFGEAALAHTGQQCIEQQLFRLPGD
jgi:hypothetical protein